MNEIKYGKSIFRKWKASSGIVICARAGILLPDSFVDRLFTLGTAERGTGRGSILRHHLPSGEYYVLRPYRRGGMMQNLTKENFFTLPPGAMRPMIELEILSHLYDKGVSVPKPLFATVQYRVLGLAYSCSIATEDIPDAVNLLDKIPSLSPDRAEEIIESVGKEAGRALAFGIFHRDLHVGNVLLRKDGTIVLIDFDKALRVSNAAIPRYSDRLVERWSRSIAKHGIWRELSQAFKRGLEAGIKEGLREEEQELIATMGSGI